MGCGASVYDTPKEMKTKYYTKFYDGLPKMEGKVVAVTGCTTGLGLVCARDCAKLGATVIMLNRPSERADAALKKVQEAAPGAKVVSIPCDLGSFASVKEAIQRVRGEFSDVGLDVLCNNAAIMAHNEKASVDGCDLEMQTNHLSHFLLTCELWPLLNTAAKLRGEARVVNHSSIAATIGGPLDAKFLGKNGGSLGGDKQTGLTQLSDPRWERYHQTKLALLVFTYALRDKLDAVGSPVKALVAHPGCAATDLQVTTVKQGSMSGRMANLLVSQSNEDGAMGIMRCCCEPGVKSGSMYGCTGKGGMSGKAVLLPPAKWEKLAPPASRTMLWEESEKSVGVTFAIEKAAEN